MRDAGKKSWPYRRGRLDGQPDVFEDGELAEDVGDLERARDAQMRALVRAACVVMSRPPNQTRRSDGGSSPESKLKKVVLPGAVGADDRAHAAAGNLDR